MALLNSNNFKPGAKLTLRSNAIVEIEAVGVFRQEGESVAFIGGRNYSWHPDGSYVKDGMPHIMDIIAIEPPNHNESYLKAEIERLNSRIAKLSNAMSGAVDMLNRAWIGG